MLLRATIRAAGRALGWALVGMLLVGVVLYLRYLRSGPELEPWHRVHLEEEFTAAQGRRGAHDRGLPGARGAPLRRARSRGVRRDGARGPPAVQPLFPRQPERSRDLAGRLEPHLGARAGGPAGGRAAAAWAHGFAVQHARAGRDLREPGAARAGVAAAGARHRARGSALVSDRGHAGGSESCHARPAPAPRSRHADFHDRILERCSARGRLRAHRARGRRRAASSGAGADLAGHRGVPARGRRPLQDGPVEHSGLRACRLAADRGGGRSVQVLVVQPARRR